MLYMVVNTHTAESCAFRGADEAVHLEAAFQALDQQATAHGVQILGQWVNRPGHEAFLLVDAPDPHAIDGAIVQAGLVGRSHTRIVSVIALDDVVTPYTDLVHSDRADG